MNLVLDQKNFNETMLFKAMHSFNILFIERYKKNINKEVLYHKYYLSYNTFISERGIFLLDKNLDEKNNF